MPGLDTLALGWQAALQAGALWALFAGAVFGMATRLATGLGATAVAALMLPWALGLDPGAAVVMVAACYYGSQYAGATSPDELASRSAGQAAFRLALLASFVGGLVGTLALALLAAPMTALAFHFGPAEYVAVMVLGLVAAVALGSRELLKGLGMVLLGLLLAQVSLQIGSPALALGLDGAPPDVGTGFVVVAIGALVLADAVERLGHAHGEKAPAKEQARSVPDEAQGVAAKGAAGPALARGSLIGAMLGLLPGGGALLAAESARAVERRLARQRAGGSGVAALCGPEAANNAAAHTAFAPMLGLGVPVHPVMALLMGMLLLSGIEPGPRLMGAEPALLWGLIVSMLLGNLLLLVLGLLVLAPARRLPRLPFASLAPFVVAAAALGLGSLQASVTDLALGAACGALAYLLRRLGGDPAPMMFGLVVGPLLGHDLRRALVLADGDWSVFVTRPLSASLLLAAALAALVLALARARAARRGQGSRP